VVSILLLGVVVGGVAWFSLPRQKPNIDEVGGTILVYRIEQKEDADIKQTVEILQRRFDYDGMAHVTVQAGEANHVEIRVPRVGDNEENLKSIKTLVSQV